MILEVAPDYIEFKICQLFNKLNNLKRKENLNYLGDEDMELLYEHGYYLFVYGYYEAAKEMFTNLTSCAPYTSHYWRALGAVNQQLEKYDEAIAAYDMAIANDESDIVSYIYLAESLILSKNVEPAMQNLNSALKIGKNFPEFEVWIERADLLLQLHS